VDDGQDPPPLLTNNQPDTGGDTQATVSGEYERCYAQAKESTGKSCSPQREDIREGKYSDGANAGQCTGSGEELPDGDQYQQVRSLHSIHLLRLYAIIIIPKGNSGWEMIELKKLDKTMLGGYSFSYALSLAYPGAAGNIEAAEGGTANVIQGRSTANFDIQYATDIDRGGAGAADSGISTGNSEIC